MRKLERIFRKIGVSPYNLENKESLIKENKKNNLRAVCENFGANLRQHERSRLVKSLFIILEYSKYENEK